MASSSMTLGIVSLLALGIQILLPFEIHRDGSLKRVLETKLSQPLF